jgi:hypothetical protein
MTSCIPSHGEDYNYSIVQSKHTQRHIMQLIGYLIALRLNSSALLDNTNQALFFFMPLSSLELFLYP